MRELYEERANLLTQERNVIKQQLDDKDHDLKTEIEKYVYALCMSWMMNISITYKQIKIISTCIHTS